MNELLNDGVNMAMDLPLFELESESETGSKDLYDPAGYTVEQVKEFASEHLEILTEIRDSEAEGKGRVTLLDWLEEQIARAEDMNEDTDEDDTQADLLDDLPEEGDEGILDTDNEPAGDGAEADTQESD